MFQRWLQHWTNVDKLTSIQRWYHVGRRGEVISKCIIVEIYLWVFAGTTTKINLLLFENDFLEKKFSWKIILLAYTGKADVKW